MATESAERTEAMKELAQAFKATFAAVRRLRGRDAHRPGELSHAQYQVLFELFRQDELSAGELAAVADLSPGSMTEMLDRLADAGLVERTRSKTDRRVVVCRLTDAGRTRVEQRHAQVEPLWNEALAAYGAGELATAAAVLDSLRELFVLLSELDGA
jgi:DNA-binding MarR family transcriptional regulator